MFGKNAVTKPFSNPDGMLLVNSIFYTMQGEGPDAGTPAVFVRLSKCNLRCHFCDTAFEDGILMKPADMFEQIRRLIVKAIEGVQVGTVRTCDLVVITGGEPFLQQIGPFVNICNDNGMHVSVETAGTVYNEISFDAFRRGENKIICSPKTPGLVSPIPHEVSAWKYIISVENSSPHDGLPMMSTQSPGVSQQLYRPSRRAGNMAPIYVQPMDEQDEMRNGLNLILAAQVAMRYGYRLSVQIHKLVGVP